MDGRNKAAMKIYTKTGDSGETGLFGGARVAKDDARVEAYGAVDELNAAFGLATSFSDRSDEASLVWELQNDLFVLGAELACVPEKRDKLKLRLIDEADIARLEQHIDALQAELPALSSFILPGGGPVAAALHQARTICRRAERRVLTLSRQQQVSPQILVYLNRLADLCFVMARNAQSARGASDIPWRPRGE
jgi:cob(I)alamin adenosyltransferase